MMDSYQEAIAYIENIPKFSGKSTMEETKRFLHFLACDALDSLVIHVAGTNGKGSVCTFLESICIEGGLRVAKFTSPHLVDTRERIKLCNEMISEEDFVRLHQQILQALPEFAPYHPSYFEFLYFIAMLWFAEQKPDVILLETGLGGRLDATNSYPAPALSVITRIGLDHTEYLGDTVSQIAGEKAGIIRENVPVIFLQTNEASDEVIMSRAKQLHAPVLGVNVEEIRDVKVSQGGIDFSYFNRYYNNSAFCISMKGIYQCENAALAVCCAGLLTEMGRLHLLQEAVCRGLHHAFWEGRMEEVAPRIYLDGAHNPDGIRAFGESIAKSYDAGRILLVFSAVEDKDLSAMVHILREKLGDALVQKVLVYLAPLQSKRGADVERIHACFLEEGFLCNVCTGVEEAFRVARNNQGALDTIYAVGSLYQVGQLKASLLQAE